MTLSLTRRALLGTAAAGTALASARIATGWADHGPSNLVIVQPGLRQPTAQAIAERHAHAEMLELNADVVRHWRDILGERLANAGQAMAYVPWAQAQILAGLAREAGGTSKVLAFAPQVFEVSLRLSTIVGKGEA